MNKVFSKSLEIAADQHGLFSIEQIKEAGVNPANVRQLAARGTLERRIHGVYMIPGFPLSELVDFMEATLSIKGGGTIADESALELLDLCDINPRRICLAVPKKYRPLKKGLDKYEITKIDIAPKNRTTISNIAVMVSDLAIRRSIDKGMRGDLAEQSIDTALYKGLLTKRQSAHLRVQLDNRENSSKDVG